jgi:hypothetical protein
LRGAAALPAGGGPALAGGEGGRRARGVRLVTSPRRDARTDDGAEAGARAGR